MTIREFARLCGCNPQTLRYYDRVELLKPARVDRWSGYRFYEQGQAMTFVKIRNLQSAGFTIEEIKGLLEADGAAVCAAMDAKIAEQEERLRQMRQVRASYQNKMRQMEEKLQGLRELITQHMEGYDAETEFGLDRESYRRIVSATIDSFEGMAAGGQVDWRDFSEEEEEADDEEELDFSEGEEYELVYQKHGWSHVKDFLEEVVPLVEEGGEYALCFELTKDKGDGMAFCNTMLGILLERAAGKAVNLGCNVKPSEDGGNHLRLMKRR